GTTRRYRPAYRLPTVHPHARGDDVGARGAPTPTSGTPPRAWGRLLEVVNDCLRQRYTPTRVGTTLPFMHAMLLRPVHPHARGDDWQVVPPRRGPLGTPPRAWGRPVLSDFFGEIERYTPTRVGTTT